MGFPPEALPSTSLPLNGINFLGKKKALPVSFMRHSKSFCRTRVEGLLIVMG